MNLVIVFIVGQIIGYAIFRLKRPIPKLHDNIVSLIRQREKIDMQIKQKYKKLAQKFNAK